MYPVPYVMSLKSVTEEMHSALPNAPVVPHRESRPRVRRATARVLRRMAERMEPMT
jgi:hypothetical protein